MTATATDRAGWTTTILIPAVIADSCDHDCDGVFASTGSCGGTDCDDENSQRHPGAFDTLFDGIDLDCDGIDGSDRDHDGVPAGPDCDDGNAGVHGAFFVWSTEDTGLRSDFVAELGASGASLQACATESGGAGNFTRCATRTAGSWSTPELVVEGLPSMLGMVPDATGQPLLAIQSSDGSRLELRQRVDAGWTPAGADSPAFNPGGVTLARGPDGHAHIAFVLGSGFSRAIRYGTDAGGSWSFETIPVFLGFSGFMAPALAISPEGVPHVFYKDSSSELRGVRRVGDGWEELPSLGIVPFTGTATFDPAGRLHVAFNLQFNGNTIFHAMLDQGSWQIDTLAFDFSPAGLTLACGDHACHLLGQGSPSQYAVLTDGIWRANRILGDASELGRLVLDAAGVPHALFLRSGNGELLLGTLSSASVTPGADAPGDGADTDCDGAD